MDRSMPPNPTVPRCIFGRGLVAAATFALVAAFAVVLSSGTALATGLSDPSALVKHDGSLTVTEDGAVVENLEIHGRLEIRADNVTVRNVWVYGSDFWSVLVKSGSARFEDVEIGNASYPGLRGIGGNNIVAVSLDIHHVEDGIKLGSNATYSGVHVHDLASPRSAPHIDAVQVEGRSTNSVVKNSILSSIGPRGLGNSAVIVKSDLGFPSDISFVNNYMEGGNFTIFVHDGGYGFPKNVSFVGNRFGTSSRYGLTWFKGPVAWEDNTWAETKELIDPDGNVIGEASVPTTTTPTTTTTLAPIASLAPLPPTSVPQDSPAQPPSLAEKALIALAGAASVLGLLGIVGVRRRKR